MEEKDPKYTQLVAKTTMPAFWKSLFWREYPDKDFENISKTRREGVFFFYIYRNAMK